MLVIELANRTPGSDATAEVVRLHGLWDEAAQADTSPQADGAAYAGQAARPLQAPVATAGESRLKILLLANLEDFSERNDVEQAHMRQTLHGLLERVVVASGVHREACHRLDRGDGVLELIDPVIPVARLLHSLLTVLPEDLKLFNRRLPRVNWMRMCLVLATGDVVMDKRGAVGSGLGEASRTLDSAVVRAALRERIEDYALCVSEPVYWGTVRQGHVGIPAADFHEFNVYTKSGTSQAWLHQPA
ncbi:hypothetical protein [Streptomyces globisporus]|uniref:hypothetical protein n=1 Tax=Streptomyces globisporus TaxID=1908 RepID=UPI00345F9698|nr:hypothetical protein OG425_35250 [Streptomyces globisporus]